MKKSLGMLSLILILSIPFGTQGQDPSAQLSFTKITDDPLVQASSDTGAAWIDYDNDNDLDAFFVGNGQKSLFRNDGGSFTAVTNALTSERSQSAYGISWGDYDNDGDEDAFIGGAPSMLYQNDGNGEFVRIVDGDIGSPSLNGANLPNAGWSPSLVDADNDGDLDAFVTHPFGFVTGSRTSNHFLLNDGPPNYTFTKITDNELVQLRAPFTVGNWSDFDLDGDMDLFIGAGPANGSTAIDFFYRNMLKETGELSFERMTEETFASDRRDGQTPNWIDIDNDNDLDFYITNWGGNSGGIVNDLYRNDNGTYVKISEGNPVTDRNISLANVWADFDNDGDSDVYVTNSGQANPLNRLYLNNGDGTFVSLQNSPVVDDRTTNWGASAGDYDNDGDIDLLVPGLQGRHNLYQNDLNSNNHWIKVKLEGTDSNRTGIGAKVRATATINGQSVTQFREVSTQNSFLGHNSLIVHFGFGVTDMIDTLFIEWPSGNMDTFNDLGVDQTITITEGADTFEVNS